MAFGNGNKPSEAPDDLSDKLDRELLERAYNHALYAAEAAGALTREVATFKTSIRDELAVFRRGILDAVEKTKQETLREMRRMQRNSSHSLEKVEEKVDELEDTKTRDLREMLKDERSWNQRVKWLALTTTIGLVLSIAAFVFKHFVK
jgi:uncharacterized protein Yka (UPF0111/DUF47 family)